MHFRSNEILIIGGGIAGLRAAIAAREEGAEVTLLSKRKAGKSGSSLVANTGHRIFSPDQTPASNLIAQTLRSGQGLADERLVRVLAEDSIEVIKDLQRWGSSIDFDYENGVAVYARCPERKGLLITEVLRERAEALGVNILDGYSVLKLVEHEGRVIGAFAEHQEEIYCFLAKAVIIATGGIGQLYHPTDNPVDITGEGIILAWEMGAELMDLEFVQFYPYQLKYPVCMDIHVSVFQLGGHLINEQGDRFMEDYPEQELVTRDVLSREMFLQQGNVYLDLMDVDLNSLREVNPKLVELYLDDCDLLVSPIQHFFMGGVRIDTEARSTVPGLFVCGEAAAGVHGANRLGGNALTECHVFGRIAGRQAAAEVARLELSLEELDRGQLQAQLEVPEMGDEQYLMTQTVLSHLMWENVGIIRDGESVQKALREIKSALQQLLHSKPRSLREWYQLRGMLTLAALISEFANYRKESRGAHYRLDFPETDPEWEGHLVVCGNGISFIGKDE